MASRHRNFMIGMLILSVTVSCRIQNIQLINHTEEIARYAVIVSNRTGQIDTISTEIPHGDINEIFIYHPKGFSKNRPISINKLTENIEKIRIFSVNDTICVESTDSIKQFFEKNRKGLFGSQIEINVY